MEGSVVIKTSSIEVDGTDVTYNRSTQLLTSSKSMTIKSSGGQIILNNNPVIDLKNQNFSGNNSVLDKGNSHIECNRLVYSQKSSIANLTGNVHGVIAQNGDSTAIQSDVAVITFSKDNVSSLLMNGVVNINSQSFGELQANQVQYTNGIVIAKGSVKSIINNSKNQGAINSKQITIYCDSLQTNFSKATRKITLLNISGNAKILADNGQYIYGNQIITDTTTYFNVNGNGKMQLDNMKNGVIVTYNVISNIILTNFLKNGSAAELSSVNLTGVGSRFSDSLGDFLTGSKIALVSDKSLDASGNVSGKIIGANAVTYSANEMSLVLGNNNVLMSGTFDGKGYVNIDNKYQVYGNHIACDLVGHTAESVGNAKIITLSERPGVGLVTYNLVANRINTLLQGDNEGVNKMDASGNAQFSSTIGDNTNASTIVLDNITQTLTANGNVTGNWVNTQGNPQTKNITFGAQQIVVQYTKQNINGPSQEEVCGAVMQGDAFLKTVNGTLRSNTINYDKLNDVITGKENVTVNYSAVNTNGHPYVVTVTGEILNYIVSQNKIYVIKNVVSNLISDGNEVTVTGQNAMFDNVAQKIYFSKNVSATEKNLNITNVDEGVYDIASQNLKIYGYNIRYNYK
ncbi:MAG: hypothetical protein NTX05_06890 [Fusobacteria bacterium]|nr:hypothetical protein [Fusobacteriota bacterium]